MSKKMLKRSLALGALMAFVITGSAWADAPNGWKNLGNNVYVANNVNGVISNYKFTGTNDDPVQFYGKYCDSYDKAVNGIVTIGNDVTIKPSLGIGVIAGCTNVDCDGVYDAINGDLSNSKVIVNDGNIEVIRIVGGYNNNNNDGKVTSNNVVEINGGIIKITSNYSGYELPSAGVIGGYKESGGEVKENKVIITGGEVTGNIYGGFHQCNTSGDAIENNVDITGGTVIGNVYGGSVKYGNTADGNIYGGHSDFGVSKDNSVNITGGTVIGNVYGGSVKYGNTADGNDVNISGKANIENANLFAARRFEFKQNDPNDISSDGTWVEIGHKGNDNNLNITGWKGSDVEAEKGYGTIGSAQNFNTINIKDSASVLFKTALNDNNVAVNVQGATWNVDQTNTVGSAYFDKNSVLVLKGDGTQFTEAGEYALQGTDTLNVEQGAKLTVEGIKETTYNVATGFANIVDVEGKWDVTNLNTLMQGEWSANEKDGLQLTVTAKDTSAIADDTGISVSAAGLVQGIIKGEGIDNKTSEQKAAVEFINNAVNNNATSKAVGSAINSAIKMAEEVGNSAIAASIVNKVAGVTNDRLSFNHGLGASQKGGHGVGLLEEGSGAAIWAQYVHGKDEVDGMHSTAGASSYEGQYNGVVMGVDFKKVGKFQSGIAFNYGEGDTNSVGSAVRTRSDYDFWGVGYYGNIRNDDTNVIFDINYAKTDSDVTQNNSGKTLEASPETTTWSAGVKLEKLYKNENVQIVPYTGLRYMSIDADDYSTKKGEFYYSMDRQNVWLLPLGVSIKQEVTNDNGWTVSPRVDLSYIWAFGDTNNDMEVKSPFPGVSKIGYDVMDDGSWLGLVGVEAAKGDWTFGVSYSYQKGDHSESKKFYVDAEYSF